MICEKKECTGCFACYNICPRNAIEMIEDCYGFIYPKINKEKCNDCNLCKKICPSNQKIEINDCIKCYAAKSKEINTYESSTSGGICTEISKYIINNNGVVYGAALVDEGKFRHIRIDNIDELKKIQGSKYVHSYTMDSYKLVKDDLKNKTVLYIGTPCQINGLKKFLMKDYDNLYTIDLICHGVSSQKFLQENISNKIDIKKIKNISFRGKNGYSIVLNNKIEIPAHKSFYMYGFLNSYFIRDNCYQCKYAQSKRCGDISAGDFWGLKTNVNFEHKKGINCVIINTKKGDTIFNDINKHLDYCEVDYQEAINGNPQLRTHSRQVPLKRGKFLNNYLKKGFNESFKKTFIIEYEVNKLIKGLKIFLKKNKFIHTFYNLIKGKKV